MGNLLKYGCSGLILAASMCTTSIKIQQDLTHCMMLCLSGWNKTELQRKRLYITTTYASVWLYYTHIHSNFPYTCHVSVVALTPDVLSADYCTNSGSNKNMSTMCMTCKHKPVTSENI